MYAVQKAKKNKKSKKEETINYKLYKIVEGKEELIKDFNVSKKNPKKHIHNFILQKEPDIIIINNFLEFRIIEGFDIRKLLPHKKEKNKKIKNKDKKIL